MSETGFDATVLKEKIRQSKALWSNYIVTATKMADVFKEVIQRRTPVKSGDTQRSWTIHMHQAEDSILWEISPDNREDIVTFLEFGTKPHVILPKKPGGVLAFYWEKIGEFVFLKKVNHPGTKPLGLVRITQDEIYQESEAMAYRLLAQLKQVWS